jgi:3-(3-hydroxy-phenyl)propionate hydroxylase
VATLVVTDADAHDVDVVVAGLGPVGAVLAIALGRLGVRTLVLEADEQLCPHPRAIHFDGEVMRIFQQLGVADELRHRTAELPGADFLDVTGAVQLRVRHRTDRPPPHGWSPSRVFHQPTLEAVLRHAAASSPHVQLRFGLALDRFDRLPDGVAVRTVGPDGAPGPPVRGRYLVGCDGARSATRRLAGIELDDLGFEQTWIVVDGEIRRPVALPAVTQQWCDPRRPTTFVPSVPPYCRWELMVRPGETADEVAAALPQLLRDRWAVTDEVELIRVATYRFHSLIADRWRAGPVLLAGDAAHQMPPFLGQGMCAGVRDAWNLAWKLHARLRRSADDRLLDTYQQERRSHVEHITAVAIQAGTVLDQGFPGGWQTQTMEDIELPALDEGLFLPEQPGAGTMPPQPLVTTATGIDLLDDCLGPGWSVISRVPLSELPPGWRHVRLVEGPSALRERDAIEQVPALLPWLESNGLDAIVLRPDRVIFGAADGDRLRGVINTALTAERSGRVRSTQRA